MRNRFAVFLICDLIALTLVSCVITISPDTGNQTASEISEAEQFSTDTSLPPTTPSTETTLVPSTPSLEPTPTLPIVQLGGPSDPNYVYEQVKNTIKYKNADYLQEFYRDDWVLAPSIFLNCHELYSDWSSPPLEKIEDYLEGDLKCEGITYSGDRLRIYYSCK